MNKMMVRTMQTTRKRRMKATIVTVMRTTATMIVMTILTMKPLSQANRPTIKSVKKRPSAKIGTS